MGLGVIRIGYESAIAAHLDLPGEPPGPGGEAQSVLGEASGAVLYMLDRAGKGDIGALRSGKPVAKGKGDRIGIGRDAIQ